MRWQQVGGASGAHLLAAVLVGGGVLHLVAPGTYEPLIPAWLGPPRPWVVGSGVAELACGLAVAVPRTRRVGGWAAAVLFVGVFPGNVQMAIDWSDRSAAARALAYGRLPLQLPLVWWAVQVARSAASSDRPASACGRLPSPGASRGRRAGVARRSRPTSTD